MIKIVNSLLCMACIAGIVAIVVAHRNDVRTAEEQEGAATGYFGGSSWRTASNDASTGILANPFVARATDGMSAGDLPPRERETGIRRWQELRELAEEAPPEATAPRSNGRNRSALREARAARAAAHSRAEKMKNRSHRRTRTLFEQSRHYQRFKNTYEHGNSGKRRRGGLPADRLPRSRFR